MYYKVMKDNRIIDVLDHVVYLKWQPKHKIMILTDLDDAQAILSSDKNTIWHEKDLYNIPVSGYDSVEIFEIDKYEYEQLKKMNCMTPQDIRDEFLLSLIQGGII